MRLTSLPCSHTWAVGAWRTLASGPPHLRLHGLVGSNDRSGDFARRAVSPRLSSPLCKNISVHF
jgi:hypothetical protein